ncbi:LuxR family maltose regulon positive regulatory protein [Thermosporothrix hazakensis]|uniref:LuxR family maltose regulon positive regulatory protein n=2 Tax=Thermosporothrix hazakensis TaxID=644383 RepID=A0A326TYF0_THEHA|nr:LuxR family maltose regulon positive regulatory protein [Thermosporothrix hazakensis]
MLTYLSGSLCDAVTNQTNSAARLAAMERAGLFLELLDETDPRGPWYRFYGLWAAALRQEASRILSAEELRTLSGRASFWYERHAMMTEAIEAALLADDISRAALLIDSSSTGGYQWDPPTLLRWLSRIPEAVLGNYPGLSLLFVLLLRFPQGSENTALPDEVWERIETILQAAEERVHRQRDLAWLGGLYAIRALSVLPQDPFIRAAQYAQQALTWLPQGPQHGEANRPEIRIWRGLSLFILGVKSVHEGRFSETPQFLQEAYTCSLITGDRHFTREVLLLLGKSSSARGELHQAAEYYRQIVFSAHEQEDHEHTAAALLDLAWLSFEWNDLTTAEQHIHAALELVQQREQQSGNLAAFQLALLSHARGQTVSAQQQLAILFSRLQTIQASWALWLSLDVLIWQARLHLVTGDLQGAQYSLEMLDFHEQDVTGERHVKRTILRARLLLTQSKVHEAQDQLGQCLLVARAQWQMRNALEIQLLLSLSHAAAQQKQEAQRWLVQALAQAQSEKFLRLFLEEGEPLARLLVSIQERGLRSYVQTILRAFAPRGLASPQRLLIEPLSPQEQRVLKLLAAGRTNPQIAQELIISVNTVKHHMKQLYRKLDVRNRLEASEAARRLDLS